MARHPFDPRAGRKARNRVYTVLAVLFIAVVIAFVYGPFGKNEGKPIDFGSPDDANTNANVAKASETEPLPVMKPKPEPVLESEPVLEPESVPEPNLPEVAPGPTIEPNPEAAGLIAKATALIGEKPGKIIEARDRLNEALRMPMSAQQRAFVKDQLSELSSKWLFSRTVFPDDELCENYQVKSGDRLSIIGERFKVPYEILLEINKISRPEALQAGETIKVINGPFHTKVFRSTFTMDMYLQNTFVRSFRVGLGKPGMETPTGLIFRTLSFEVFVSVWVSRVWKPRQVFGVSKPGASWKSQSGLIQSMAKHTILKNRIIL
ncbi:MAG: LysM peptidoglycan-binding domain-containing protein [Planctomycetota bacterium]|jgi:hypothetical protein